MHQPQDQHAHQNQQQVHLGARLALPHEAGLRRTVQRLAILIDRLWLAYRRGALVHEAAQRGAVKLMAVPINRFRVARAVSHGG